MPDEEEQEEDLEEEAEEGPGRSSAPIAIATAVLLLGLGLAAIVLFMRRDEQLTTQGLDVAAAPEEPAPAPEPVSQPVAAAVGAAAKTFGITGGGMVSIPKPAPARPADARGRSEMSFTDAVRKNEAYFRNLTIKYQRKYPVFKQWGKEWMSHPELNKACREYYEHHNPVRFAFQIASSPNLPGMVSKYSRNQELHAYLRDMASSAPREVVQGFTDYIQKDGNAIKLIERFAAAAGLPPALVAGFTGKKVDERAVMQQIMEQNPGLQGTMGNQPAAPPVR